MLSEAVLVLVIVFSGFENPITITRTSTSTTQIHPVNPVNPVKIVILKTFSPLDHMPDDIHQLIGFLPGVVKAQ